MEIIQIIIGRYLVELFGASIRYLLTNFFNKIKGNDLISFSKLWSPKGDQYKKLETETSNRIAGLIFFVIFFIVLFKFTV